MHCLSLFKSITDTLLKRIVQCFRKLVKSYPMPVFHVQEDFEFDRQAQFQDPRSTSESTTPMEGENMGGWWPEHCTPDTGVRPARQFPLACTWSSAHSFGKFVFIITLQTYWVLDCGCSLFFLYYFSSNPAGRLHGVIFFTSGVGGWEISSVQLWLTVASWIDAHLTVLNNFGTGDVIPLVHWLPFSPVTQFSLDTCMLVELPNVCWGQSTEFL